MSANEAQARIKINRLLEKENWRFFDDENGPANVRLEPGIKITRSQLDALGNNFENTKGGRIDYLLLDSRNFPLVVLEAKAESKHPLVGKEQAREYAISQKCRFILLSNGNEHYFWDLERGNPYKIVRFPTPESIKDHSRCQPNPDRLVNEKIEKDYIALTQMPRYSEEPSWQCEEYRSDFIDKNGLRFLRNYQLDAVRSIKEAVKENKTRFLFEMATGTGKTLTSAAVIKLFLKSGNASRVLFLVDRLELEDQAWKAFTRALKNDYKTVIFKESRNDWQSAEIVVTTVQSLLFNNKFKDFFSPTDFDFIISDESHRSINGNRRAVFEYFVGYKLGLTATPKDYLKRKEGAELSERDPREIERREILDTYKTFGCESGQPTFRYTLLDGVRDGFLVNPITVDARTDVTTKLLAENGYPVLDISDNEEDEEQVYFHRDFEKKFFSESTNHVFCETFLKNALRDPISNEIGKTIIFGVSQKHAAKLTQILNEMADRIFPGKYNSDFALQVTSHVSGAQQYTKNFEANNLSGSENFLEGYKTSKTRVCVTVGMMTTGYDCPDLLNLCFMRPVFSPSDFIQMKGRGTRKYNFFDEIADEDLREAIGQSQKTQFKLFDYFANCEYFEERFNYDEELNLPKNCEKLNAFYEFSKNDESKSSTVIYENFVPDKIWMVKEEQVGYEGMKIDRMFFKRFEDKIKEDVVVSEYVAEEKWDLAAERLKEYFLDQPSDYVTIEKLSKAAGVGRLLNTREILEKTFGRISDLKTKDQVLEEEYEKFLLSEQVIFDDPVIIPSMRYFFKAYAADPELRDIIDRRAYSELYVNPSFRAEDFKAVPEEWRNKIPKYVTSNVKLKNLSL